jgi:hypothetical protein
MCCRVSICNYMGEGLSPHLLTFVLRPKNYLPQINSKPDHTRCQILVRFVLAALKLSMLIVVRYQGFREVCGLVGSPHGVTTQKTNIAKSLFPLSHTHFDFGFG